MKYSARENMFMAASPHESKKRLNAANITPSI
jgi:hypothetical protein